MVTLPNGELAHVITGEPRISALRGGLPPPNPLTTSLAPSVGALATGFTLAVIDVVLATLTLETVTTLPSEVPFTVAVVAGQDAVAAAVVVNPVPVMMMEVGWPAAQTFGDIEAMNGTAQISVVAVAEL